MLEVIQLQSLTDQLKQSKLKRDSAKVVTEAKKAVEEFYEKRGELRRARAAADFMNSSDRPEFRP